MTNPTPNFAADLAEMLAAWNTIEAAVKAANPRASKAKVYRLTAAAMSASLGMSR